MHASYTHTSHTHAHITRTPHHTTHASHHTTHASHIHAHITPHMHHTHTHHIHHTHTHTHRRALGTLQRTLERITSDLAVKDNSLAVDHQCMQTRERLSEHPKAHELMRPPSSTTKKD